MATAMQRLMAPRSVAVVGASERPGASAGFVVTNLLRAGFAGRIVPVHPSAATVFGLAAVPRLADLGETVDAVAELAGDELLVRLRTALRGVAPGQTLVLYRPDPGGDEVLGSATIA